MNECSSWTNWEMYNNLLSPIFKKKKKGHKSIPGKIRTSLAESVSSGVSLVETLSIVREGTMQDLQ